ncbi:MAG: PilZ domain-containing protein [Planctomycetota bacterium]
MVGIGTGCFLQLPGESKQRVLHPARVVGLVDEIYTVESEERDLPVTPDMDVLLYFERNREFTQQSGRIEAADTIDADDAGSDEDGPRFLISFKTTGEPVSAESRQHYRVSTVLMGYQADLNVEKACHVLDVSSTGLAVISRKCYTVGNVVDVSIVEDGQTYTGNVCVQSIRDLGKGRTRYGLHCVSHQKAPGTLAEGLQRASMRIQREQLRRLAGNA